VILKLSQIMVVFALPVEFLIRHRQQNAGPKA